MISFEIRVTPALHPQRGASVCAIRGCFGSGLSELGSINGSGLKSLTGFADWLAKPPRSTLIVEASLFLTEDTAQRAGSDCPAYTDRCTSSTDAWSEYQYCGKLGSISRAQALMPPRSDFTRKPALFIKCAASSERTPLLQCST
jgi:hypothetical protein